jgi:MFS family permease
MDRRGVLCVFTLFLLSICLIAFAFITTLWLALLLLTLAGFFEIIFLTTDHVLIQLAIPDHLRGGVTSVMSLNNALTLLGGFIAGAGSDLLGGPKVITIILAGATATLAVLFLIFSPTVRNYRLKHAMSHAKN